MLECMAEWMSFPMYYAYDGASPPPRAGASHATIYPYGPFPAGDGRSVMLGLQNEREWATFCDKALRQPDLKNDPRFNSASARSDHRAELREIIVAAFKDLTADQVVERLEEAQIGNAQMNDMHDLWKHAQLAARHRWTQVNSPAGPLPALLPPGAPADFDVRMDAIPAIGEHTDTILATLGYSRDDVARLRAENAI